MSEFVAFGGTFDPVHFGHIISARDVAQQMGYQQVHLVPCGDAYHKGGALTHSTHRLAMLEQALAEEPWLLADGRETRREGATYTIDTLKDLRSELGPDAHIAWVMGSDTADQLTSWHNWRSLFELANVIVVRRAHESRPNLSSWPCRWMQDTKDFKACAFGAALELELTPVDISSTDVRCRLKNHQSVADLVPPSVLKYINTLGLYRES
ncbi:nicotinate-nucleotide adenylyltransferase [Bermanella marisrubri]|uniref:Probable nicotinate-nucleotide adenylyltransferase n=1 Tax=Bermanella marisrubri TaxID=207949 RepID=Q1N077_9GAMM|nr:nicotinate-nucleotide adenylyltransferase [Bermanella marisrubri]EAT11640.1 nicotinate-nucleotide adenylyltransferase [Oceanobacter sp. RED65] [Bermanella marisrubri]QIZ83319.1 nicotinate-nucleotide adenylyltransferase [Bermanella marisrubri]